MLITGSHLFNQVTLLCDELQSSLVGTVHQFSDLLVDELGRGLAVGLLQHRVALPWKIEGYLAHLFTHPKLHNLQDMNNERSFDKDANKSQAKNKLKLLLYLSVGWLCDFLQVVLSTGGNSAKENLLSHTTTQHHAHPVKQLLPCVQVLLFRQVLCVAQTFPTWNNGNLTHINN